LITANQPFGAWSKVFPDQAMTLAAIDRLVHHATILEMNVENYRRRAAAPPKKSLRSSLIGTTIASLSAAALQSDCRCFSHPDCRATRKAGRWLANSVSVGWRNSKRHGADVR
jgi:hypothetical protein